MKNGTGTWDKRQQYRKILKKLPPLYEVSESLYEACRKENQRKKAYRQDEEEGRLTEAWTSAFCYVLAPALFLYLQWVLEEAVRSGRDRLYFLSRDGYMMYRAAKYLCGSRQLPIACRYLYCSRYALRSGEYNLLGEESLHYICLGGMQVTLEKLLLRGGLDEEEVKSVKKALGPAWEGDAPLTYEQIKALYPLLKETPLFMERMLEHAKEAYPKVIGYLRQEGLMDDCSYAIVDSGWTGSIQRSMNRLLKSAGYEGRTEGYYFGMYEYVKGAEAKLYHTYYFAPERGSLRKAFFCNNLFECVFSSPEGMTTGYCIREGSYQPLFAGENRNHAYVERGTELLCRYAQVYEEKQGRNKSAGGNAEKEKAVLAGLLSAFMGRPSLEEAKAFGRYVFNDDVAGEEKLPLAREMSMEALKESRIMYRLLRCIRKGEHPAVQSAWQEGSLALTGKATGADLWQCALYKFLLYAAKSRKVRSDRRKERENQK